MMSESEEEEWTTVRRRRNVARDGAVARKLKALAIPVVPLGFDALAEPEERPPADQAKSKKKKKKKAREGDQDDDAPAAATTAAASGGAAAAKAPATTAAAKQSLLAWLLSQLWALLVMLGLASAAGGGKRKRRPKSAAAKAAAAADPPAAAATAEASSAAAAPAAPKAAAAAPAAKDKAPATGAAKPATEARQGPGLAKPAAAAPSAAAAAPKTPSAPAASAAALAAAAATALPSPPPPFAAAAPSKPSASKPAATPAPPASPAPAAATPPPAAAALPPQPPPPPPPPAAPAVRCDADWARGKLLLTSLPGAHADVISAVALAGDLAVSAGYDGAVKVWHWPAPGASGGGIAPRLALGRSLVGHSGRVEALAVDPVSRRLASSGRDSTLKVWELGEEPGGAAAREVASTYVYESVRSLAADWGGAAGGAPRVLLGSRSSTVMLYALAPGGGARKLSTLRGHEDEVTALKFLSASRVASGSRDGSVRLWDLTAGGGGGAAVGVLTGLSGRVCSLALVGPGDNHLVAGDCSSTVKLWDLRMLTKQSAPTPRRLPNAPGFAGDSCPTAGLWHGARCGVLLSSSIAWWTANKQALEEAPTSATLPTACINVHAVGPAAAGPAAGGASGATQEPELRTQQLYTLRLGPGVVTCMTGSLDEHSVLAGGATGSLWALQLVRGSSAAVAAAERAASAAEGCEVVDALAVGADEFSDDEYEDEDGEEGEEEDV